MSAMGIEGIGFPGFRGVGGVDTGFAASGPQGPQGPSAEFGELLVDGIDRLEGLTDKSADLALQAATGDLQNIHDYTIAATEAEVATQLTVAVRNKAVDAFNEIMRMPV